MKTKRAQLDRVAIRTVLSQMGEASYQDIALRAGEGLASPLMEMVAEGRIVFRRDGEGPRLYRIADGALPETAEPS